MEPKSLILALAFATLVFPAYSQVSTGCTPTMLSTVTPCLNLLTNSTANGTSPLSDCCGALRSLTRGGMDCVCLIVTASVPFRLPINRTLAISLPRTCNMPGVPVECRASRAPLPAPGPGSLGPSPSPTALRGPGASAPEPASVVPGPTGSGEAPESDNPPLLTPPSPSIDVGEPTGMPGIRPDLTPSAAFRTSSLPSILLLAFGLLVLEHR